MKQGKFMVGLMAFGVISLFAGCGEKEDEMAKVTLNEVAHSIFYAPQYVALENGYFTQEGIDLELVTGYGADKTMAAVISGDAQIGFIPSIRNVKYRKKVRKSRWKKSRISRMRDGSGKRRAQMTGCGGMR